MKANSNYEAYQKKLSKIADLIYAGSVLSWDQQIYMPKNGAEFRGQQMATLTSLAHEMATDPKLGELLKTLSQDSSLDDEQKTNIRLSLRDFERKLKYPADFVEEQALVTAEAFGAWSEARAKKDFSIFKPHLEKIVALKRREAKLVGYQDHVYNALLEDFEPGLTVKKVDEVFTDVKNELFPFIKKILSQPKVKTEVISRFYAQAKQWQFAEKKVKQMGYDFDSGRADNAPHPFCTTFGPGDVRITIRHDEHFFNMMFFAAIHEAGHGLYELGLPLKKHYGLPMASSVSMAFHESQSRFWENKVCRSLPYWKGAFQELQNTFPDNLAQEKVENFYHAVNAVEPSFIRVEADELTYHAHIYIRYLVEKELLEGKIEVSDVPKFWNDRYEEYLGIRPENDADGCLQDVHWAYGAFGYFPTYSFGSFYAAQLLAAMKKQISGFDALVEKGELKPILNWLRENVHVHGRRFSSEEILTRITGSGLQFKYFMDYAKEKYGDIYGIKR